MGNRTRGVVTGRGICARNGGGVPTLSRALKNGDSGIRFQQELADLEFGCRIAGKPEITDQLMAGYFTSLQRKGLNASGLVYGVMAGMDAWTDAGLRKADNLRPDWESGI